MRSVAILAAAATVGPRLQRGPADHLLFPGCGGRRVGRDANAPCGLAVPVLNGPLDGAQRILAIAAGLLMIAMALQFFGLLQRFQGVTIGFAGSTLALSLRNLLTSENRAAPVAWHQRLSPCPSFMLSPSRHEHRRSGARLSRHAIIRIGHLSAMLMSGGCALAPVAATRRLAGWQLHPHARPDYARTRRAAFWRPSACVPAWKSGMTERDANLCNHCLLPVGLRAMQRTRTATVPSALWLLHRLSGEARPARGVDAAWLLIRLGVGAFSP